MKIAVSGILLILCTLVSPVYAGQQITIVRGQDFPPYHFLDSSQREKGFLIDLILKAGAALDLDIRFRQFPWSRCLNMVASGKADAMMNLFKTPERMTFMYFPETPLAREVNRFFTLKKAPLEFTGDFSRLGKARIGAVRNYSYGKAFDDFSDRLNVLRLETETAMILNLINHRCDLVIGNEVVIKTLAGLVKGGNMVRPLGPGLTNDPLYIGFSKAKGHKALAEQFSRALKTVKASPAYQKILTSYGL